MGSWILKLKAVKPNCAETTKSIDEGASEGEAKTIMVSSSGWEGKE